MTTPRLFAPDALDRCLEVLLEIETEAGNVWSKSLVSSEFLGSVLAWHAMTERLLTNLLAPTDLHELLYSPRLWALRSMDITAPAAKEWAELELIARRTALKDAREALHRAKVRWRQDESMLIVPDTNLLLHHENTLLHIPWRQLVDARGDVRVVLPLMVVDELDNQKRNGKSQEVRTRARVTLRELRSTGVVGNERRHPALVEKFATTTIEVLADAWDRRRLSDSDLEIVDCAVALSDLSAGRVTILTSDVGMEVRAGGTEVNVTFVETNLGSKERTR